MDVDGLKEWLAGYEATGSLGYTEDQKCVAPIFAGVSAKVMMRAFRQIDDNDEICQKWDAEEMKTLARRNKRKRKINI